MSNQLSDGEKSELRTGLLSPVMQRAIESALRSIWKKRNGADTIESAAMAYNYQCGASDLLDELFSLAELKTDLHVPMRKLRH